jgi:hypothetical protein
VAYLRNIVFKRLTACGLLALLLIIHAAKFFHHHPIAAPGQHATFHSTSDIFLKSGYSFQKHCAICDFQVTKDADITIAAVIDHPSLAVVAVYSNYVTAFYSSHTSFLKLRGPPAIA